MKDCDFAKKGFATEKERDRHWNDRHDPNPTWYYCKYQGCAYGSKRESNCKQHMEKSHGYGYIRTKQSGKRAEEQKKHAAMSQSPMSSGLQTPQVSNVPTPAPQTAPTPNFTPVTTPHLSPYHQISLEPSPAMGTPLQPTYDHDFPLFNEPPMPTEHGTYNNGVVNNFTINNYTFNSAAVNTGLVNQLGNDFSNSDLSPYQPNRRSSDLDLPGLDMDTPSVPSSTNSINGVSPTFASADMDLSYDVDWDMIDRETRAMVMQLPTPETTPEYDFNTLSKTEMFSPIGKGDLMIGGSDEGYDDSYDAQSMGGAKDFTLFESASKPNYPSAQGHDFGASHAEDSNVAFTGSMFQPLQSLGPQPQTGFEGYSMFPDAGMTIEDILELDNDAHMEGM